MTRDEMIDKHFPRLPDESADAYAERRAAASRALDEWLAWQDETRGPAHVPPAVKVDL